MRNAPPGGRRQSGHTPTYTVSEASRPRNFLAQVSYELQCGGVRSAWAGAACCLILLKPARLPEQVIRLQQDGGAVCANHRGCGKGKRVNMIDSRRGGHCHVTLSHTVTIF
jgi:hypothetical protein